MINSNYLFTPELVYIANCIESSLPDNMKASVLVHGSALGGAVIIDYFSNAEIPKTIVQNSMYQFSMMINLTDEGNRPYPVGYCVLLAHRAYKVKSIRSIKVPTQYDKVISRVNKYILEISKDRQQHLREELKEYN